MNGNFHVFADAETLAHSAVRYICEQIERSLKKKKPCRIALPGGSTPARCLTLLGEEPLPWDDIEWYLGDERCLPAGHAERNDRLIRSTLFVNRPEITHFFPIKAELGAEKAAQLYEQELASFDHLDMVILGMGEDGHTASLFPGNPASKDTKHLAVPVHDAPKPPPERVSLGLLSLRRAGLRILLASGKGKAKAIQRCRDGQDLPAAAIGESEWFIDEAANGGS